MYQILKTMITSMRSFFWKSAVSNNDDITKGCFVDIVVKKSLPFFEYKLLTEEFKKDI